MEWKNVFLFLEALSLPSSIDIRKRVFVLQFFVKTSRPEVELTYLFLLPSSFLLFSYLVLMLKTIETFLVRKDFEISKLTHLLHFLPRNLLPSLFLSLNRRFVPIGSLFLNIFLHFFHSFFQNSSVFELIRYLVPQICEVVRLKSPLYLILLLRMVLKEGRIERLMLDIAMFRWNKI